MNPSKKKGTRAETNVVKFLNANGFVARRQALAGSNDQGDIEAYGPDSLDKVIIEVKGGKQTVNPSRRMFEEWLRQARVEADNAGETVACLCIVKYNKRIQDADMYIDYGDGRWVHMFLDEYVKEE